MSATTGIENAKQLVATWDKEGNVKGLFKQLKDCCKQLQLPRNGSTATLVQRLMAWIENNSIAQLKKEAIAKKNKPALEKIVAKTADEQIKNIAKEELKEASVSLKKQLQDTQIELTEYQGLLQAIGDKDPDFNQISGHCIQLGLKVKGLKIAIKQSEVKKQKTELQLRKEKMLKRIKNNKQFIQEAKQQSIEQSTVADAIEVNNELDNEEEPAPTLLVKKSVLFDRNGNSIAAINRKTAKGWCWVLCDAQGKRTNQLIGCDKAKHWDELAMYGLTSERIEVPAFEDTYIDRKTLEERRYLKRVDLYPVNSIVVTLKKLLLIEKAAGNSSVATTTEKRNEMKKLTGKKPAPKKNFKALLRKHKKAAAPVEEAESDPFEDYEEEETPAPKAKAKRKAKAAPAAVDNSKEIEELKAMIKAQSVTMSSLVQAVNKLTEKVVILEAGQSQLQEASTELKDTIIEALGGEEEEIEEAPAKKAPAKKKAPKREAGALSDAAQAAIDLAEIKAADVEETGDVTFSLEELAEYRDMPASKAGPMKRSVNGLIKKGLLEEYGFDDGTSEYGLPGMAD